MKKLSIICFFLLFSIIIYSQTKDSTVEIIKDLNFSKGIGVKYVNHSEGIIDTLYPFSERHIPYIWDLAQWYSRFNLKGVKLKRDKESIIYANQGKRLTLTPVKGSTEVSMEVFGAKEYLSARKADEGWPHLLLEQNFHDPLSVSRIKDLKFRLNARLMYCENKMKAATYNPKLHTAQFSMYLVIQNLNKKSSDYKDYIWYGLHLYDYRYREIPKYEAKDKGKKDATGKFIYCPASDKVYNGYFQNKKWINISKDILPSIKKAFKKAQEKGYLKGSSINDMHITGMNIGWEVTGTFNCGIQYKNLGLTATIIN